jgi:hypothetical protein
MEVLENRSAIVVRPSAASHGFREKFVQEFVQSVPLVANNPSVDPSRVVRQRSARHPGGQARPNAANSCVRGPMPLGIGSPAGATNYQSERDQGQENGQKCHKRQFHERQDEVIDPSDPLMALYTWQKAGTARLA